MKEKMSKLFKIICYIVGGGVGTFLFVSIMVNMLFMFRGGDKVEGIVKMYSDGKVVEEYEYYDRQRVSDNGWLIWLEDGSQVSLQGDLSFKEIQD